MNASSRDDRAGAPPAHLDRLLALVDEVDFVEQLGRAERLMDRRRDELLRERRAAVRARRRYGARTPAGAGDEDETMQEAPR